MAKMFTGRKKSSVNEMNCNTVTVNSFRKLKWKAHKLSDQRGTRFTGEKPCDILLCSPEGFHGAVESKLIKKWEKVSLKDFRTNQIEHLDYVSKTNFGKAWAFIHIRIGESKAVYVLPWEQFRNRLEDGISPLQFQKLLREFRCNLEKDDKGKDIYNLRRFL